MGKSKWNWWRRHSKRQPLDPKQALKGKSFLLQQIEHGDFDYSEYRVQALEELVMCEEAKEQLASSWICGPDSLRDRLDELDRKYIKRYNKLMQDHDREENKMLHELKESLIKEFGIDIWDEALDQVDGGNLKDFYYTYRQLASKDNGTSKFRSKSQISI
jgi:hypothetical protein